MQRLSAHRYTLALGAILVVACGLRLWAIDHGLPFVYNRDEEYHFVPLAIRMFGGDYDPGYFQNPSGFTYLLHVVFQARFEIGGARLRHAYTLDPGPAVLTARVLVVMFGTAAVALTSLAGRRLFDRRVGLIAAALSAVAFLPVFYSHLALNDVVALVPITAAIVGCIAVYEHGSRRAYALTGLALGLAIATKYTAVAYAAPLVLAAVTARERGIGPVRGLAWGTVTCAAIFAALNPYLLIDHAQAARELHAQMTVPHMPAESALPPIMYYPATLTWGLGWLPAVAAVAGAVVAVRRDAHRAALVLAAPAVLLLMLATGNQLFARWLLPAYPALAILAAYGAVAAVDALTPRVPRMAAVSMLALAAVALSGQGALASIHLGRVLSREDTRTSAHAWLMRHAPAGSRVVIEPFLPRAFNRERGRAYYARFPMPKRTLDYEGSLHPGLVDRYKRGGWCRVVVGSYQRDRGLKEGYPGARAYYRRLTAEAEPEAIFRPYRRGARAVGFDYDASFNFGSRAYWRPGPEIVIYLLRGCPASGPPPRLAARAVAPRPDHDVRRRAARVSRGEEGRHLRHDRA